MNEQTKQDMKQGPTHRFSINLIIIVLFAICLGLSFRLHLDQKITSMLPDTDSEVKNFSFFIENLPALETLYIDIASTSDSQESLRDAERAADDIYDLIKASGYFSEVLYTISNAQFINLLKLINERPQAVISPFDLAAFEQRLNPEGINNRLGEVKRQLLTPSGLFMRDAIQSDPLDINGIVLEKLEAMKDETAGIQLKGGRIFSGDGKHILMLATPTFPAVNTEKSEKLIGLLTTIRESVLEKFPHHVEIGFSGAHIATYDNSSVIRSDVQRAIIALSVGIIIIGLLIFSRKIFVFLIFLPTTFSLTCASAFFAVFDPYVSAIGLGCGAVLVGITVDFGVHVLFLIDNSPGDPGSLKKNVKKLYLPLAIGTVTTITAFSSLLFSSLPGQRQMGLFAALGVFGAAVFAAFVLVYFIPERRTASPKPWVPLLSLCSWFLEKRKQNNRLVFFAGILVLALSFYGTSLFTFEGDVSKLNHLSPEVKKDNDNFLSVWGAFSQTLVLVKGETLENALKKNDTVFQTLADMEAEGIITRASSISSVLPSLETQKKNIENWNNFWSPARKKQMVAWFKEAMKNHGFSSRTFDPFYEKLERQASFITRDDYKNTAMEQLLKTNIARSDDQVLVLSSCVIPGTVEEKKETIRLVTRRIQKEVPGAMVLDKKHFVEHTTSLVRLEFKKISLIAGLGMIICLFVFMRRPELVLGTVLPVLTSVIITTGTLGLMGVSINLISILFIVFVFGVGVDFSVFLMNNQLSRYRGENDHDPAITSGSVIICALTTTGGFLTLVFANHGALFSIGVAGLTGMTASLMTSLIFIPAYCDALFYKEGLNGTPSIKTILGTGLLFLCYSVIVLFYTVFLRFIILALHWGDKKAVEPFARRYLHWLASIMIKAVPYPGSKRVFIGDDPEVFREPSVIVSNYNSVIDYLLLLALPVDLVFGPGSDITALPFIKPLAKDAGFLPDSETSDDMTAVCLDKLSQQISVVFFTSGSDAPKPHDPNLWFKLAARSGSTILPVAITNSESCLSPDTFWIDPHHVVLRVLPGISVGISDVRDPEQVGQLIEAQKQKTADQDQRLAMTGLPFLKNIRTLYNYRGVRVESCISKQLRQIDFYEQVESVLPRQGKVLDMGSCYGLLPLILAKKSSARSVSGIETFEKNMITATSVARCLNNLDVRYAPLPDSELPKSDAIIMLDALTNYSTQQQTDIISKACCALNPGGMIFFRQSTGKEIKNNNLEKYDTFHVKKTGWNNTYIRNGRGVFDADFYFDVFKCFKEKGFSIILDRHICGNSHGDVSVFKKVLK